MNRFNLGLFIYTAALVFIGIHYQYPWPHHDDDCDSTSWLCNIITGIYSVMVMVSSTENQRSSIADVHHICEGFGPFSKLLDMFVTLLHRGKWHHKRFI